jgi:hypothetical protein
MASGTNETSPRLQKSNYNPLVQLKQRLTTELAVAKARVCPSLPCMGGEYGSRRMPDDTRDHTRRRRPPRAHDRTSSARARRDGGRARPRALAVFRLITSSNRVGGSTGRFAGFAPWRI